MIPMMVVPTLTRHDLLGRMLASVDYPVRHLVVIDNSGRGVEVPDGPWERVTVLPMPSNLGVAGSWNLAVKMAHRDSWVLICSDDMWWPAGTLQALAGVASEETLVLSGTWPYWEAFALGMGVVAKVGLFDEGYYPAYYEDTEFERRARAAGVVPVFGPEVGHDNASTLMTPNAHFNRERSLRANEELFHSGLHGGFNPYRWRDLAW